MKKTLTRSLLALMVLGLSLPSLSQTNNCGELIKQAADAGRAQANNRAAATERTIQKQVERSRNCLEAFGDAGSRQAMVLGGFDLAPLRNALMDQGCAIIQREVNATMPSLPPGLSKIADQATKIGNQSSQPYGGAGGPGGYTAPYAAPTTQPAGSGIWDRLSCSVAGKC